MVFGMELNYGNKADAYNGNIGSMNWKTKVPAGLGLSEQLQSFVYDYDKLNRLTKSAYTTPGSSDKFNEELDYDVSGNIGSLKRKNNTSGYLNSFTYNYADGGVSGNRLVGITDVGTGGLSSNYTYNENGNQVTDSRKALNITYNVLNLPQSIGKPSTGENMGFIYDASGQKLRRIIGSNTRDYISGIEYSNGILDFIKTEEGRALPGFNYTYDYMLKDHLGNIRATVK